MANFVSMLATPDYPCFYYPSLKPNDQFNTLPEEEFHHLKNVLRLGLGDKILVSNGCGLLCEASLIEIEKKRLRYEINSWLIEELENPYQFELLMATLKNRDRLEWLVEKCTEVGIKSIHLVKTDRSQAKAPNLSRLKKNAIAALKQSRKGWLPTISYSENWQLGLEACQGSNKFIAYCEAPSEHHLKNLLVEKDACLAIGPEGDFTSDELEMAELTGFKQCTLGNERLRAETAAIFGLICYHSVI